MKICNTCGNEIQGDAMTCPFCESQQTPVPADHGIDSSGGMVQRDEAAKHHQSEKYKSGMGSQTGKKHGPGIPHHTGNNRTAIVNLEAGKPIVDHALTLLDIKIREMHLEGIQLIKVIHGWGSSGKGGRIKKALPAHLDELKQQRVIHDYLSGEQYSNTTPKGRHLMSKYPELNDTIRPDRRNPGITFVEL